MVISLLVLLVLTVVGTMFLVQTNTETQIAGQDQRWTQSLFNAEAGYGEVLARMSNPIDTTNYIGQQQDEWTTEPGWGAYVVTAAQASTEDPDAALAAADGLDNDGDGSIDETGERYPEITTRQTGADLVPYPWAKVRYKLNASNQPLLFGDHDNDITTAPQYNLTRGMPVLVVTSQGEQGATNRTVEVEAVKYPFQTVNAALYCEDDEFKFNGTAFLVSGQDWDPATEDTVAGNPAVPGIMTTKDPADIADDLKTNQRDNVEGEGAEPSILSAPVDLDLEAMAAAYSAMATIVLSPATYANTLWGGYDDYRVVHCTGDLHTSGQCGGGGLLIVDGDFDVTGQFIWYGLVIVLGDIKFTGGGMGIHIYGSVLCQGGVTEQVVGGNADILYSSAALARLAALSPYVVSSWRER
jgi:hypothetical protein